MGAVAAGAILTALFLVIVAVMVWQSARRSSVDEPAAYFLDDAAAFVWERLSVQARDRVSPTDVRSLLEGGIHYHQVVAPRDEHRRPVVGSGDAIEYLMERAAAAGRPIEPIDIAEVIAAETEYLLAIGAIGSPVEDPT
ncbi:MAG: hypothetical protein A2Z12_03465 [Actinobacteria bacterium RBG_16_68_21]|nr:MAG: hypothetical protein A2Z12_03465 [Actinobacteria bacterium RBG_16_68_21]